MKRRTLSQHPRGATSLISEVLGGLSTLRFVRRFCQEMLEFPREALGVSEALWPQRALLQWMRRRLTK